MQAGKRAGMTLIEVLVTIAIIAILAGILIPVLALARDKARQIFCLNNQRQLALKANIWAQEHEDSLPPAGSFFTDIEAPRKILTCMNAGKDTFPAYTPNPAAAGRSLGDFPNPSDVWLTADGAGGTVTPRHHGRAMASYVDSHVAALKE